LAVRLFSLEKIAQCNQQEQNRSEALLAINQEPSIDPGGILFSCDIDDGADEMDLDILC
jgi:hypothetical protein